MIYKPVPGVALLPLLDEHRDCGWLCLVGFVWVALFGWLCLGGFVWVALYGWLCLAGFVEELLGRGGLFEGFCVGEGVV